MEIAQIMTLGIVVAVVLFVLVVFRMISRFLVKARPGEALVKTGFGLTQPKISLSSAGENPFSPLAFSARLNSRGAGLSRASP